jgi:tRNA(Ile)-lysidine synthetase-like protein
MTERVHPCEAALSALPQRLLVAVSGGVDSVALLEALVRTGHKPVVLHVDHGWRAESADEARMVRALARQHGLKIIVGKVRATKRTESTARAARYAFFAQAAKKSGLRDLVLAHHADDQVETFLLQLLRGAGSGGRGMEAHARHGRLVLHRPWLALWKKEIIAYARAQKLTWSEDSSNADTRHRRNLVRHRLLPYLAKLIGPETPRHLWRAAEIARAESEWLDELCSGLAGRRELPVAALRAAPLAQQRRTILRWLQAQDIADIAFADVEAVRRLLTDRDPAKVNLSGNRFARRRAGTIFIA